MLNLKKFLLFLPICFFAQFLLNKLSYPLDIFLFLSIVIGLFLGEKDGFFTSFFLGVVFDINYGGSGASSALSLGIVSYFSGTFRKNFFVRNLIVLTILISICILLRFFILNFIILYIQRFSFFQIPFLSFEYFPFYFLINFLFFPFILKFFYNFLKIKHITPLDEIRWQGQ
jgi:cell shape-determining protein MreD